MQIWPGTAYPLGATYDGSGTNFALFSEVADRVELCLFDEDGDRDPGRAARGGRPGLARLPARRRARPALRLPGVRPVRPEHGQRCNPNKLLLDPYAKAIDGQFDWDQSLFGYNFGDEDSRNDEDSAPSMPKSVVINPFFDWGVDRPPKRPYADTVIYEAHVKGLTELHPDVPEELRGTYAGVAHPAVIEHLQLARGDRHRADAGAPLRQRFHPAGQGTVQLLGLQHHRVPGAGRQVQLLDQPRAARSRSSRRWCGRCTPPASR